MVRRPVLALGVAFDRAAGRLTEEEGRELLPGRHVGRVVELTRVVGGEIVLPGRAARAGPRLLIQAHVVAAAEGVAARRAREGRLKRIDAVDGGAAHVLADHGDAADFEARQVVGGAEHGRRRGREAERGRVQGPFVLAHVRLLEPLPAGAQVQQRARADRPHVVAGEAVVDAIEEVADRPDAVDLAGPVAARLLPVVAGVADEQALRAADAVIAAERDGIEVVGARVAAQEVVPLLVVARLVRERPILHVLARDAADPRGRHDVAGEGLALDAAVGAAHGGGRVVDGDAGGEQLGEVAVAHLLGRHRELAGLGELVVEPFDGGEEERPVLQDRPAGEAAEPVVAHRRLRPTRVFEEEVVLRQLVVAVVPVALALEGVGAALDHDVHRGARGVALLGVERRGLDLELRHRAGWRDEGDAPAAGHVGRPVEGELVAPRGAVGHDAGCPAVVEGPAELEISGVGDAGREARQRERVAVRQRQQGDALLVDHLALRRGQRVEQRALRRHGYHLRDGADFQGEVQREAIADAHGHALADQFLEAHQLGGDRV